MVAAYQDSVPAGVSLCVPASENVVPSSAAVSGTLASTTIGSGFAFGWSDRLDGAALESTHVAEQYQDNLRVAQSCIEWASVPHTSTYSGGSRGFPDPGFFANCYDKLDSLGISKTDDCTSDPHD
jgi:hypothetical protein